MPYTLPILLIALALAAPVFAQPPSEQDIRDAIARGTAEKGRSQPALIVRDGNFMTKSNMFGARIYTPLAWIEQRAADAAATYQPIRFEDVTPDMLEPVVHVVVPPYIGDMHTSMSVQAVVLKDAQKAVIRPVSQEPYSVQAGNALGAGMTLTGMQLRFPLHAWQSLTSQGRDFSVVVVDSYGYEHEMKVKKDQAAKLR